MRRQFLSVVDGASGTPRPQHAPRGEQQSLSANAAGSHEALTQLEHIVEFISWQHVAQTLHATSWQWNLFGSGRGVHTVPVGHDIGGKRVWLSAHSTMSTSSSTPLTTLVRLGPFTPLSCGSAMQMETMSAASIALLKSR
eukprot:m.76344 g.76344  ORF g.76344 m.76344 type:complete len:140 (+) comp19025_c0_seq1:937-1356(+)